MPYYDQLTEMCVGGTSVIGLPPSFEVTVPSAAGQYLAYPGAYSNYDPITDEFAFNVVNASGALVNDFYNDGFTWPYEFDAVCSDYPINDVDWLHHDGFYVDWWPGWGAACPAPSPPPPAPLGRVPSGPQTCTAGDAEFQLAARGLLYNNDVKATMWLTPLLTEDAVFPERAWLRELEVLDWGGATNLVLAGYLERLTRDGWDLGSSGATKITPANPGPTVANFDSGEVPMLVMMGTEEMPLTGQNTDLPTVKLTWSCEFDPQDPHAVAVPGRSGHVAVLSELLPIKHRLVFWVADDETDVRLAPEGRYLDYIESALTTSVSGGKSFMLPLRSYDAILTGRLVPYMGSYQLKDGVVTIGTSSQNIPTKTLTAL